MNEPPGATVMLDSSGNDNHGAVDPTGVETGGVYDDATAYNWVYRSPTEPPASPERVVSVPDDEALEPVDQAFTVELRTRFTTKFGNIAQKGQSATPGGQWKIQSPGGKPSCLFKGSEGRVATQAKNALDDGEWHMLTCVFDSTGVSMYVDGDYQGRKNGSAGTIDNDSPMTIGGKLECDQVSVTCDYYTGQVDSLTITKGPNLSPDAAFDSDCPTRTCSFDATASSDPDGEVVHYDWEFGDGAEGTGATPSHIYSQNGTFEVKLKVTDNRGETDVIRHDVVVDAPEVVSQVQHVDTAIGNGSSPDPTVDLPATASVDDRVLLIFTTNTTTPTYTDPDGVTGWTELGTSVAKTTATTVWTKAVEAGDPGTTITVPLTGGAAKYNLAAAVYSGVDLTVPPSFAYDVGESSASSRLTPEIADIPDGSWVVSHWADKSSSTTAWTAPSSVTTRAADCGTGSAHICSLLADSAGKVPSVYGNIEATTNAASSSATMWTVTLPSVEGPPLPNRPPEAQFTPSCVGMTCSFDASGSSDPDGDEVTYDWTFGDGNTDTGISANHGYSVPGTYDVTLTVTDGEGLNDQITQQVTVDDAPVAITRTGSAISTAKNSEASVDVPAGVGVGDRLILVLSVNSDSAGAQDPAGWTQLDSVNVASMTSTVWTKTAEPADLGSTITVPLGSALKTTLTLASYAGTTADQPIVASATLNQSATTRSAPEVTVPDGAWALSYWADKSSSTNAWTTTAATEQAAGCAPSSGRICSLLADSNGPLTGTYGPIEASTDNASNKAAMWSIVLASASTSPQPNRAPEAQFTPSCVRLACSFDASGSSDLDGDELTYDWTFGDGSTDTGISPTHDYDLPGNYDVTLTVTDDEGLSDQITEQLTVDDDPIAIARTGSAISTSKNSDASVDVPAAVGVGDRLVLVLSVNSTSVNAQDPPGWTQLDSVEAGSMTSTVWTKTAESSDLGSTVNLSLSSAAKTTLTLASYAGTIADPLTVASATMTQSVTTRSAPEVTVPEGSWVLSYWADKSSSTNAWTTTAATEQESGCAPSSGRVCSLLADSNGPVTGTYGPIDASTDDSSNKAVMWSIVLSPGA